MSLKPCKPALRHTDHGADPSLLHMAAKCTSLDLPGRSSGAVRNLDACTIRSSTAPRWSLGLRSPCTNSLLSSVVVRLLLVRLSGTMPHLKTSLEAPTCAKAVTQAPAGRC